MHMHADLSNTRSWMQFSTGRPMTSFASWQPTLQHILDGVAAAIPESQSLQSAFRLQLRGLRCSDEEKQQLISSLLSSVQEHVRCVCHNVYRISFPPHPSCLFPRLIPQWQRAYNALEHVIGLVFVGGHGERCA